MKHAKTMKKPAKPYEQMTLEELREATREFDKELPVGPDGMAGRPLNAAERRQWNIVQRDLRRPRPEKGFKRVTISVDADLLKYSDAYARRHNLNWSQLVAAGLRRIMAG
jgi:hypothetical protein